MKLIRHLTALLFIMVLAACSGAPAAPQPTVKPDSNGVTDVQDPPIPTLAPPAPGGSVSRALTTEPTGLDPAGAQGSGQNVVLPYLFDTLITQDFENNVQALLADKWVVADDAKTIEFTLREGVTFHDGTPLDAAAVVASFERLRSPELKSPLAANLRDVTAIEAVDPRTVRFSFAEPSATFFGTVASPYAGIVSPAAVAAEGEQFAQKPVGSGPFKLKSWEPGVAITLERNEAYRWGPPMVKNRQAPYLESVVFKVVPDAATQLAAFEAGEVDFLFLNQPDHITRMRGDDSAVLEPLNLNSLAYLGFNYAKAPFDDLKVRQALAHAIDKGAIIDAALGGEGVPAFAPMATTLLGFDTQLAALELGYDPAKTEALLSEAGFAKGADGVWAKDGRPLALNLLTYTRAPNQDVATVIQAQLKAVGVPVEITQLDAPAAGKAAVAGEYDLLLWRYDWNDPDVLNVNLNSARIGSTNRVFYSNPEVDRLLTEATHILDTQEREQRYLDAQKLIMADAPWQPLYTPVDMLAFNPRLEGVRIGSMGRVLLNDVTVK